MGDFGHRIDLMTVAALHQSLITSRQEVDITWNPSDKGANITLSNGNLDATGATAFNTVRATLGRSAGLYYFEQVITALSASSNIIAGIVNGSASLTTFAGGSASGAGHQDNGSDNVTTLTLVNDPATTMAVNDVYSFAINFVTGKAWVGKNGTWMTGDPAAGTSEWVSGISGTYFPAASPATAGNTLRLRTKTSQFTQTIPTGFMPWARS